MNHHSEHHEHAGHEGHAERVELDQTEFSRDQESDLRFRVIDGDSVVTDYEVEHEREMHLIVVRKDLTGFQHLHPKRSNGTWSIPITFPEGGDYRVFADFKHGGQSLTVGADMTVAGEADYQELPPQQTATETSSGYRVEIEGEAAVASQPTELTFKVLRDGEQVRVEPYLGADGHLVALREGDLAFLHVHPMTDDSADDDSIRFMTEFPSEGRYRLFLQFQHHGAVHTAAFTREVSE